MALLKIKKPDLTSKRMQECLKEIHREEKKHVHILLDKSLYKKLKRMVLKQDITCTKWISDRIRESDT